MTQTMAPLLPDPQTDKKPPLGPSSVRPSSSLETTAARPNLHSQPQNAEPEKMAVNPSPHPQSSREAEMVSSGSGPKRKENLVEDPAPSASGMRSRLQRLAEQRKCWDGSGENILYIV